MSDLNVVFRVPRGNGVTYVGIDSKGTVLYSYTHRMYEYADLGIGVTKKPGFIEGTPYKDAKDG